MKVFEIVAVKDELAEAFLQPTFVSSKREGERIFSYQINSIPLWKENPADFSLYHLGTYDPGTGTIIGNNPTKIMGGRSVVKLTEVEDDIQHPEQTEE